MNSFSLVSAAPAYGGSAEPCEAIGASLRTQVKIVFPVLLIFIFLLYKKEAA